MKKLRIADGIEMSWLALGDCKRGNPAHEADAFAVMDRYMELGGNTFDSARVYNDGGADKALGKWLKSRGLRDSAMVVTKGSHPGAGSMFTSRLSGQQIEQDLNESLAFMGMDHSTLHLLHRDDVRIPVEDIVPSLDALVRAGKTRAVGVSNWSVGRIIAANQFAIENGMSPLRCSQLHFGLAQTTAQLTCDITHVPMNDIEFGWYRESQLPVMCFGAQARGWFAARAAGVEPKDSPRQYYDLLPENHRRLIRLQKLAEKLDKSITAVTTAYVRNRGLRAIVLSSFSKVEQLAQAYSAIDFKLSLDQIKYLETGVGTW